MSVADTGRALEAMTEDDGVRDRLAAGDFSDAEAMGLELTAEERSLLQAGAADVPEVEGFLNPQPLPPVPDPGFADGSVRISEGLSPFGRLNAYVGGAGGFGGAGGGTFGGAFGGAG